MAEPRRIVLADPLARGPMDGGSQRTRFAVAGQGAPGASGDVKMYEWDGEAENMSMVGLQSDVGAGIKALAWSPNPAQRHLLALGLSTGRTHLLSLSPSSLTLPLRGASGTHAALLTVKHSRSVTSLAFSPRDPCLLATAYERHRSDYSLLIWDVADAIATLPPDPEADPTWTRPPERLEPAPQLANAPLRSPTQAAVGERETPHLRRLQQYCASEVVHSVAWVSGSSHELLASANNKVMRLYDLRVPTREVGGLGGGAVVHWQTRAVHYITPDPDRPKRLASVETTPQGGIVRLWDTRRPNSELCALDVQEGSGVVSLEWAAGAGGGGALGVGTRDGGVSIWDIATAGRRGDGTPEWTTIGGMRNIVKPKQQLQSFAFTPPASPAKREVVFVVKDGAIGAGEVLQAPLIAFSSRADFAVSSSSLTTIDPEWPLRGDDDSPLSTPSEAPRTTGRSSAADETRKNRFQLAPERISALLHAERDVRSRSISPGLIRGHSRRSLPTLADDKEDSDSDDFDWGEEVTSADGFRRILKHDVAFVMRRRAEEGYGLNNLLLNAAIATRFPGSEKVAGVWEFIDHFIHATGPEVSRQGDYDLTFQGLFAIWSGLLGPEGQAEAPQSAAWANLRSHGVPVPRDGGSSGTSTPRRGPLPEHDADYNNAIAKINGARTESGAMAAPGSHRLPHTDRAPQRRMMLAVCGENHTYDTMQEVNSLVHDNQRTKAACWAFFAGEEEPAITILMRSEDEKHRLMGATIAGFMTQSRAERGSLFWQEHWRGMVDKVDDPYVRPVLARIAGENWESILYDESLPLLDRVAVAVCNLGDKELTGFLRNRLNRCVNLGSLPGLALTGFSPSGITLLQRFVDRTGDVQTAAILSAFFPREHLGASELSSVERWQDAYRNLMDSWLTWVPRCAFDVGVLEERRRLGDHAKDAVQTVVVCPVCNRQITKQSEEMLARKNALKGKMAPPTVRTNICVYCQNALARCCICLLHVRGVDTEVADTMDTAYVACQTCRHGGHASHILAWFEGGLDGEPAHDVCPVAGCDCQCGNL